MSVRPRLRADGRWHANITIDSADGRRRQRHVAARTEADCWRLIVEVESARDSGRLQPSGRPGTVAAHATAFLNRKQAEVRPSTWRSYESHLRNYVLPAIGHRQVAAVTTADIDALLLSLSSRTTVRGRPISPATVNSVRVTLTVLFNYIGTSVAMRHPVRQAVRLRDRSDPVQPLTSSEVSAILAAASYSLDQMARWGLGLVTGCRQGEVLGLTWADFDDTAGSIRVSRQVRREPWRHGCADPVQCAAAHCRTRTCPRPCARHTRDCPPPCPAGCTRHASRCPSRTAGGLVVAPVKTRAGVRTVHVDDQIVALLRALRDHSRSSAHASNVLWSSAQYIFPGLSGPSSPRDPRVDWGQWKELLDQARVRDVRVHDQRHWAVSTLVDTNVDPVVILARMGWTSMQLLVRYQHPRDKHLREAAVITGTHLWGAVQERGTAT